MAQTFLVAPLNIKTAAVAFAAVDCELNLGAALDGMDSWQATCHNVSPTSWPAMVSAG